MKYVNQFLAYLSKEHRRIIIHNLFSTFLPIILTIIPITYLKLWTEFDSLLVKGELILLTTGVLSSSMYIINEHNKEKEKKIVPVILNILIIIYSVLYALIFTIDKSPKPNVFEKNNYFVITFSIIGLIISLISIYYSTYVDVKYKSQLTDVSKSRSNEVDKFTTELENMNFD